MVGENALEQSRIDRLLLLADGTENKEAMGANAVLGVSLAVAKAAARALRIPLYQYLGGCHTVQMPVPMMNILNGGRHTDTAVDLQEFMIVPLGADCYASGLAMGTEIYHTLKKILKKRGFSTGVGDEGGFAPEVGDTREALSLLMEAIETAGYVPGKEVGIAMDAAASELYQKEKDRYAFPGESRQRKEEVYRSAEEMISWYEELLDEFPIVSMEDGLQEDDFAGWAKMTRRIGGRVQLVGDDLFVTNRKRLEEGIKKGAANAVLIKVNQIGTLTEAMETVELAKSAGYRAVISHRSGETEDPFLSDFAVACGAGQIKTGAPCRSERTVKYNQLLRIEERLGDLAVYSNPYAGKIQQDVEN